MSGRRGRPPGFEREAVVAAARDLYWTRGLAGTAYDELTVATGLHRPSLHAAFGDKRGLFEAALQRYLSEAGSRIADALGRPALKEAIAAFFAADIDLFVGPSGGRGCYALGVTLEAGRQDAALAELERQAWHRLDRALDARVRRAGRHELPEGMSPELLRDLCVATHVTLSTRARAGESRQRLRARVARFLELLP